MVLFCVFFSIVIFYLKIYYLINVNFFLSKSTLLFVILSTDNLKKAVQIVKIVDYWRRQAIEQHLQTQQDKRCFPWQTNLPFINYNRLSEIAHDCGLLYEASLLLELSIDPVL